MEEHRGGLALLGPGWSAGPGPEWSPDRPLRVVAVNCLPYISVEQRPDGSLAYSNVLFQLWQIMAEELGLSYEMVAPLTDGFGTLDGNGTWIGVIGDLVGGRADLALQRLGTTPDRIAAVDFLNGVPFDSWSPTFFVRRDIAGTPPLSPAMFASLLRPLGADVWWTLAATLLALSLVLRLSLRFNSARAEDGRLVRDMGWGSCLFAMALTVLGQGWHRTPRPLSGRTATIIGWFLGILIFINYTANLMSFLAVPRVVRPISSVREFVEQPDWTLAMYSGARKLDELRSSLDPDERELYRRSITGLSNAGRSLRQTLPRTRADEQLFRRPRGTFNVNSRQLEQGLRSAAVAPSFGDLLFSDPHPVIDVTLTNNVTQAERQRRVTNVTELERNVTQVTEDGPPGTAANLTSRLQRRSLGSRVLTTNSESRARGVEIRLSFGGY
ncbi:Glutamate receptor [Amphibalanus amphitrite]|uniref:Glutamate receptor n=1 Tax=Amphibalanus amphitrite TaxID=1232801 RepID=A0A6A4VQI6_AMPAM|nr:Glutamate receptor [Amphibalanus amphitrite]